MFTDFGRAIWELRTSNHDDVFDMERKTGIDSIVIAKIEMGTAALSVDILDKVLAAYKPNKSISVDLRKAFIRTKVIEQWGGINLETEVYYWYAEAFNYAPSGRPILNVNGIFNGPFFDRMEAIADAEYKIEKDAAVYVFSCLEYYLPGYINLEYYLPCCRNITYDTVSLCYTELLNPPHKPSNDLKYIFSYGDFMEAKERFIKRLKKFYSDGKNN